MKKLATAICAAVMVLGLAACSGSAATSSSSATASGSSSSAATAEASSSASTASAETSASSATAAEALSMADLAVIDTNIEFGDYDGMVALAKAIQNGEEDGTVVKIDGYVSNFTKGMSYSIVERNADDTASNGTNFVIEGVEEDDYPQDETHIVLTGKVGLDDSNTFYVIHTLPEAVEVAEEPSQQ